MSTMTGAAGSLVPLLLADCDVPAVLAQHATLDCRTQPQREASAARIRERLGRPEPAIEPIACPYPGMQPFTAATAARFTAAPVKSKIWWVGSMWASATST